MSKPDGFVVAQRASLERERAEIAREREQITQERAARAQQTARERAGITGSPEQVTMERLALSASRPRKRRWKELEKFDAELERLQQRHTEALARLSAAEAAVQAAPAADAERYARWLAAGESGEPPKSSLVDRVLARDGCAAFVDGVALEISRLLERRVEHVKKYRAKMLEDAHKDVTTARAKYTVAIRGLLGLRAELIEAREVLVWAAVFPDLVEPFGTPNSVGLGLAAVTRDTLGTTAQLEFSRLLALLERDGEVLAKNTGPQAKKALGTAGPRAPTAEAMWDDEPDMVAWKQIEKERARMLAERDFHDPHLLAAETRD